MIGPKNILYVSSCESVVHSLLKSSSMSSPFFQQNLVAMILVAHAVGDYLLQTHRMSQEKTKNSFVCLQHSLLYSIPYIVLITGLDMGIERGMLAWGIISSTHFFIDRFLLATWYIYLVNRVQEPKGSTVAGYPSDTPPYLAVWLPIIIDNIFHVLINIGALCE